MSVLILMIAFQGAQEQTGAREWVERLRSDSVKEREEAAAQLRTLGEEEIALDADLLDDSFKLPSDK